MIKFKYIILFICLCSLISISSAELINPGFETGDLTGWTNTDSSGNVSVTANDSHSGTYSVDLRGNIVRPDQNYPEIIQPMPIEFDRIKFYYKVHELSGTANPNCAITIFVNPDTNFFAEVYSTTNPTADGWIEVNVTRAEIMANNGMTEADWGSTDADLIIDVSVSTLSAGTTSFYVYFDDFNIMDPSGPIPTPTQNVTEKLENKMADAQNIIVIGIYIIIIASLTSFIGAIIIGKTN